MASSDGLLCLFSGRVEQRDGSYVVEVPKQEVRLGKVVEDAAYRVALLPTRSGSNDTEAETEDRETVDDESEVGGGEKDDWDAPPVEEGEVRTVEIEGTGDQGDGITRVERGFVVIVPETEEGERVEVEIETVRPNVAFAEVIERVSDSD